MPTIQPTHASAMSQLVRLDEPMTPERELQLARMVLQDPAPYGRPVFPERPAVMVLDDHELLDAYRAWEAGVNLGADKRRALGYFGAWREGVWRAEGIARMHLLALVHAAQVLARADLPDEADVVWSFTEDQYGVARSRVPELDWIDMRDWCASVVRDYTVLPRYLRSMTPPTGGVPFHKPPAQRDAAAGAGRPPDDDEGQRELW